MTRGQKKLKAKDLNILYGQAKRFGARYLSRTQQAEDFAQYVFLQLATGRKLQSFEYFLAEYFRIYRANHRNQLGRIKSEAISRMVSIDQVGIKGEAKGSHNIDEKILTQLTLFQRITVVLFYQWGLTLNEIGQVVGKSEAWASLERKGALERLRKFLK